jgi:hypothetical protein
MLMLSVRVMRRLATVLLLASAAPALAQARDSSARAAIVIQAEVSAREVRFAKHPTIKVTLAHGTVDSVRIIERHNLPDPVQPGVTYRDVRIAVEILGHVNAQCLSARITRQTLPAVCSQSDTTRRSP